VDATLTADQRALVDVAAAWLAERFPPERAGAVADARPGWDPQAWQEVAQLGWVGLDLDERLGGGGASLVETVLVAELGGRHLLPLPLVSTWSALPVLRHDADLLADVLGGKRAVAPARLGERAADLGVVTDVLVLSADTARLVPVSGCRVEDEPTIDGSRSRGRLVGVDEAGLTLPLALVDRAAMASRHAVLLAAESVGAGQRCLDLAVEHARTRHQFGRPIGSYQAVAFALADAHLALDRARSLTYWAAWQLAHDLPSADRGASAAQVAATDAAVAAAEASLQALGGIGMTWDAPLHRWYKRALVNQRCYGTSTVRLDEIGTWLLEGGWD
jgi:acyl-CoA dehydrogenase